jgi:beta-galactosidase
LQLVLDDCGRGMTADGADWIRIYAHVCDARGTTYPYAETEIRFSVRGEGRLIEDDRIQNNPAPSFAGIATGLIRATTLPGAIMVEASAFGLKSASLRFLSAPKR